MTNETIKQALDAFGLKMTATLARDDFDGFKGMATWAVTIVNGSESLQTGYSMGCAHRHYRNRPGSRIKLSNRLSVYEHEQNKRSVPVKPDIVDVMYSLLLDAQGVRDGQTFEDWASELGYDEDSRSADRIFNTCRDNYFGLKRLIGENGLNQLSELYQDY